MITEFPRGIHEKLKYYVYLYIDPRNREVFYVGKGNGNRAFAHLREDSEKEKVRRIQEIRNDGQEPIIEILVHGIENDETAKKIEASVIDLIGMDRLTNIVRGYESREYGRMSLEQIVATYDVDKAQFEDPVLLININKSFRFGMPPIELYDATRSAWVIGRPEGGCTIRLCGLSWCHSRSLRNQGLVSKNSTFNTRKPEEEEVTEERWEFVGQIAAQSIRSKYLYKDVSDYVGAQNPIRYVNC